MLQKRYLCLTKQGCQGISEQPWNRYVSSGSPQPIIDRAELSMKIEAGECITCIRDFTDGNMRC